MGDGDGKGHGHGHGHNARSIAARFIDARPSGTSAYVLAGLFGAVGLFGLGLFGPRLRRRRHA